MRTYLAVVAIFTAGLVTSCGDDDAAPQDRTAVEGAGGGESSQGGDEAPNPVDILKKIEGCVLEPGVTVGEDDINGNRYASCFIKDYIDVTARTFTLDPFPIYPELLEPDDSHRVVLGDNFMVNVTADPSAFAADVDMGEIAAAVGGEEIPLS
jgi:hypothetical protein